MSAAGDADASPPLAAPHRTRPRHAVAAREVERAPGDARRAPVRGDVDEAHGGSGLSRLDGALIFEALAYGCPTISAYLSIHNMVAWMVSKYGSDDQRAAWMDKLVSME